MYYMMRLSLDLRYSPILRSADKLTAEEMTLWDQALKYILPMGFSGTRRPAIIFDRLFVAMPFPNLEYRRVLCASQ